MKYEAYRAKGRQNMLQTSDIGWADRQIDKKFYLFIFFFKIIRIEQGDIYVEVKI